MRWPTLKSTAPTAQVSFSDETAVPSGPATSLREIKGYLEPPDLQSGGFAFDVILKVP